MKNLKNIIFSVVVATLLFSGVAYAQGTVPSSDVNPTGITSVNQILAFAYKLAGWFQAFFFAIAIIYIIMAAFAYLQSAGDVEKIEGAKNKLIYAVVAIVVAILAFAMRSIVSNFLGVSGTGFCISIFGQQFCF